MTDKKIADRIRKLLALSHSSNQNEAATAAARAAELMAEHRIHAAMLDETEHEPVEARSLDTAGRVVTWKGALARGIAHSFGCRTYWSRDFFDIKVRTHIMVVGRDGDVDAVRYTYLYLCNEIDRLAADGWRELPEIYARCDTPRRWKNAFRVGAATAIARRLVEARDQSFARARAPSTATDAKLAALVRIERDEAEVDAFMATLRLRRASARRVSSASGLSAGSTAGRSVDIGTDHEQLVRPAAQLKA